VDGALSLSAIEEEAVYHICQEALNNALKHARATQVSVTLNAGNSGEVTVQVSDNGRGFDFSTAQAAHTGMGLHTMRERAEVLGGQVTFSSTPGTGTTVQVWLPGSATHSQSDYQAMGDAEPAADLFQGGLVRPQTRLKTYPKTDG
jgi:signal transduction histidine kinase